MSYDLVVFAPEGAPRTPSDFDYWYQMLVKWNHAHPRQEPSVLAPNLHAWLMEMIQIFPALNGPYAKRELPEDESLSTDYDLHNSMIYACFAWSKADQAYETVLRLAGKHGVGFLNASSAKSEVWFPDGKGNLVLSHSMAPEKGGSR